MTNMFSRVEREYLMDRANTSISYSYVLECRIRKKLNRFYRLELPLILGHANLAEFHNDLTENTKKLRTGSEPATFTLPR